MYFLKYHKTLYNISGSTFLHQDMGYKISEFDFIRDKKSSIDMNFYISYSKLMGLIKCLRYKKYAQYIFFLAAKLSYFGFKY